MAGNPMDEKELEHRLTALESGMGSLQREMGTGFDALRDQMGVGFQSLRDHVAEGFSELREQMENKVLATEKQMGVRVDSLGQDVDRIRTNEQRHTQWALGLLSGTLVLAVITLALKVLHWL